MLRRHLYGFALTTLLLPGFCDERAVAENWTRFRGPNGSGHAAEGSFPATWSDDDYLWKIKLTGIGHGSPVGWENRLFVTSGDPQSGALTLQCLSADTGEQLWNRSFAGGVYSMHNLNSYASTTPAVDAERVYVTWSEGGRIRCAALTHEGKQLWEAELGDFVGNHGFAASPLVSSGVVCLQVDQADEDFLVGIDAASGEVLWRAGRPAGSATYSTPCVIEDAGREPLVIAQSMAGGLQAIELKSGKIVWGIADVLPARTVSSPILVDNLLVGVCGGGGSGKQLVALELAGSGQPVEKLTLTKNLPYVPTPLAVGPLLFLWHDQGRIALADLASEDPSKLLWNKRIGGKYFGSPVLAGDKIYCMSMEGHAVVIAADREFTVLGDNDLGEPSSATPAVHDNKLYLRTESTLACLAGE